MLRRKGRNSVGEKRSHVIVGGGGDYGRHKFKMKMEICFVAIYQLSQSLIILLIRCIYVCVATAASDFSLMSRAHHVPWIRLDYLLSINLLDHFSIIRFLILEKVNISSNYTSSPYYMV